MKWPKIRIRREQSERTLIVGVCSAALVLLLSLKRSGTNGEPYEGTAGDIPREKSAFQAHRRRIPEKPLFVYEDGDGYLVPVQRSIMRQTASRRPRWS